MSKVYILCENNDDGDKILHILKVFSDHTLALKALYICSGFLAEGGDLYAINNVTDYTKDCTDEFYFNGNFCLEIKTIDASKDEYDYEFVFNFKSLNSLITKEIWMKVIDELPEKETLKKLILFKKEMAEFACQERNLRASIKNELTQEFVDDALSEKLNELNLTKPKLQL